jgi:hypothetical protein
LFYTTITNETLYYGEHKVMLKFQMHMSSNMLLSVENFNVKVTF